MSEHDQAIRQAQRLLRRRARSFPEREVGYHVFAPSPYAEAYEQAARELEDLIEGDYHE